MMTTTAPPWLRRSDQAVTWARGMLSPHRAVVIDCETTDLLDSGTGGFGYLNPPNGTRCTAMWGSPILATPRSDDLRPDGERRR